MTIDNRTNEPTPEQVEAAAKALEDAASAWQMNGWSNDMPEKGAERAQIILHMAQAATDMLRARAAEYRKAVQP